MKQKIVWVALTPIILNFLLTFRESTKLEIILLFLKSLPLTILIFFLLYLIGLNIKLIFKFKTITYSISFFFMTIFIFDNIFLLFTKGIRFKYLVYIYCALLLLFSIYKSIKSGGSIITQLVIFCLFAIVNLYTFEQLYNPNHLDLFTSDEARLWMPATSDIYENNYYQALKNSSIEGYGLLAAYVKALIFTIVSIDNSFTYFASVSNVFLLLFLLLILEIKTTNRNKIFFSIVFLCIFFTNNWINYLFFNSLLGEGPCGYIFGATIFEISKNKNKIPASLILILSFNIYGKNFLTVVSLVVLFFLLLKIKKSSFLLISMIPFIITFINSKLFNIGFLWQYYLSSNNTQRSSSIWSPENFLEIFQQFFIDKTLTIVFLLIIFFYILSKNKIKKLVSLENIEENVFFVNMFIVFFVYIFLVEEFTAIQDSYRYIISTMYLFPVILSKQIYD